MSCVDWGSRSSRSTNLRRTDWRGLVSSSSVRHSFIPRNISPASPQRFANAAEPSIRALVSFASKAAARATVHTQAGVPAPANPVVIATNAPFDAGVLLHTKLAAYTTYAVALEIPRPSVPVALYWDTEDPYHYIRTQPGENGTDFLIVGGERPQTGPADDQSDRWARLVSWTRERFPVAGKVRFHWSGQVFETPDGLGLIRAAPWGRNLYVITGDSGMGMTHSTLGAKLVGESDLRPRSSARPRV